MTQIKTNVELDSNCKLTVIDVTGDYNATTNPTGFIPESSTAVPQAGFYKRSYGKFVNVLKFTDHEDDNKILIKVISTDSTPNAEYDLKRDGYYNLYTLFIPTRDYLLNNRNLFGGKVAYYLYNNELYTLKYDNTEAKVDYSTLIDKDLKSFSGVYVRGRFLSTCGFDLCKFKLNEEYVEQKLKGTANPKLVELVNFVNISAKVIEYLEQDKNYTQIVHLLKDLMSCGGLCHKYLELKSLDCGCNGN